MPRGLFCDITASKKQLAMHRLLAADYNVHAFSIRFQAVLSTYALEFAGRQAGRQTGRQLGGACVVFANLGCI